MPAHNSCQQIPVTIQPLLVRRVVVQSLAKEDSTHFCATQRQTKVTRAALVYAIYGKATGLVRSSGEGSGVHIEGKKIEALGK